MLYTKYVKKKRAEEPKILKNFRLRQDTVLKIIPFLKEKLKVTTETQLIELTLWEKARNEGFKDK